MLTDHVEGTSWTYVKNPDYWGYDEKYPDNRLPYVDEIQRLISKEQATILAMMRTGKADYIGYGGDTQITSIDAAVGVLCSVGKAGGTWSRRHGSPFGRVSA